MTTKDFTANVISATKVVPDGNFKDSKASGIWDINEALDLIKGGNWPNAANINPSAFVSALFQTHLYTGTDDTQTITNNIDLTKGGLVWIKSRSDTTDHHLCDTERGVGKRLVSNSTAAQTTFTPYLSAFNNDGFEIGSSSDSNNSNNKTYVSWTFREQPKFFDIITYTGNGSTQSINHNLNSEVGMMFIKEIDEASNWFVYHKSLSNDAYLILQTSAAKSDLTNYITAGTSTIDVINNSANTNGRTYVAYLFAHNDDDGGFGEPGDQDIIKCGSYTGNTSGTEVDLGFEPQFVMIKKSSAEESWYVYDNMRGVATGGDNSQDKKLRWNSTGAEGAVPSPIIAFSSKGFILESTDNEINGSGTYVYMAIRRGGMQTPTAASDVFAIDTMANQTPAFDSTFPVDMVIRRNIGGVNTNTVWARITGSSYLNTNATDTAGNDAETFDSMVGFGDGSTYSDNHAYMWARARGYFDVVTYTGTSPNAGDTKSHNLGVVPEMIWLKNRNGASGGARSWMVYHKQTANTGYLKLDANSALITSDPQDKFGNNTVGVSPTASVFTVAGDYQVNYDGDTYIAYLFATVAGVSKVGSFTQSGATNVACGFTGSTPALIILKRTDSTGDWYLFDSLRGIVAGNDPYFILNDTTAPTTNADMVDPYSGGFATTSNIANGDYIFYAIAAIS